MYRLNNIKQNILIVSFATLLSGCGGGGTTTSTDSTTSSTEILKVVAVQTSELIITENSATIEWIQNDNTVKLVEYGTSKKYDSELLVKEESTITLYNLQANTTYHYRIVSEDKNGKIVVSRDKTFTTLEQSTQPIVTEPIVTEPAPTEPIVTEPAPTEPIVTEPAPTEPIVTEPAPTEPIVTEPVPTEPIVTEPAPTEPIVTEPVPTEPIVTEPVPTEPIVTEPTPEPVVTPCMSGPAQQLGQIKDSISRAGLSDVTVTIAGCSTKTDADGYYTLDNIVENENAVVNIEKEGYLLGSTKIQIKELSGDNTTSINYLEYAIDTYNYQWSYDSQTNASGANINIPASAYMDTVGDLYTGTVAVALEVQDVTTDTGKALFPGSFEGQNTNGEMQQFVSHGLISLSFKDANGNPLNFSEGVVATLTFNAVSSMDGANIIPLWYYDNLQGLWIEEGYAELQADGTYQGEISHPGTWSLNQPIENDPGIYTDRILYPDGTPVQNLRVHAVGVNWISTDLNTDENGVFEIEVIPGEEFTLKAYHYADKHSAAYNGMISAITSGEIVDNSKL